MDNQDNGQHLKGVVIDFLKYVLLIAAAFMVATRFYFVSFLGALLFIDMFTRRFAKQMKPLYAVVIFVSALIFMILT